MEYPYTSEKELIEKSKENDDKAFEEIVSRDAEYIYGWIMQKTKDEYLAQDLFQTTLIKCWKNIKKFKGDSAFKTWACAIARNLFIDNCRKAKRRNEEPLEYGDGKEELTKATIDFDPLKNFKNNDLKIFLNGIMNKLTPIHRSVLYYSAVEELTYKEISKIEKCSVGTVMSRLFYARKKAQTLIHQQEKRKDHGID